MYEKSIKETQNKPMETTFGWAQHPKAGQNTQQLFRKPEHR